MARSPLTAGRPLTAHCSQLTIRVAICCFFCSEHDFTVNGNKYVVTHGMVQLATEEALFGNSPEDKYKHIGEQDENLMKPPFK